MNGWILALETTGPQASLLLARNGRVLARRDFTSERTQEQDLFEPLADLLAEMEPADRLVLVLVGTGPGSYNGARVGIAAAQAVAQVHGCPVAGICSFETTPEADLSPHVWAVGDARRGSFFILPIENGRAASEAELWDENHFLRHLAELNGPQITFESPDRLPEGTAARLSSASAEGLIEAWGRLTEEEKTARVATEVAAFYLRPPHITKAKNQQPTNVRP